MKKWINKLIEFGWFAFIAAILFIFIIKFPAKLLIDFFHFADGLSYVFLMIAVGSCVGAFYYMNLFIDFILRKIANKYPKLKFLDTDLADKLIQQPISGLIVFSLFIIGTNLFVHVKASSHKYESISKIEGKKPVVVLGTSKLLKSGNVNLYYKYRIETAIELWKANKVDYFILSGDGLGENHKEKYNEIQDMRSDLLAANVPADKIKSDSLGLKTLDSSLRLRSEFGVSEVLFVSQGFHTSRAIVQTEIYGIKAYSYDAKGSATFAMFKKEFFESRPAVIVQTFFVNAQPRFLSGDGKAIEYRKSLDASGSKIDFGIYVLSILLFLICIGSYFFIKAKQTGEDKRKARLNFSFITTGLTVVIIVLVSITYTTLDIPAVNKAVERIAKTFRSETKKMEVKRVEGEAKQIELSILKPLPKIDSVAIAKTDSVKVEVPVVEVPVKIEVKQVIAEKKPEEVVKPKVDSVPQAPKVNPIKLAFNKNKKQAPVIINQGGASILAFFNAKIHGTQKIKDNDRVSLRLSEGVNIKGEAIPENYVFEARANIFNNRITLVIDKINNTSIAGESYNGDKRGIEIRPEIMAGTSVVLNDGDLIKIGYSND